MCLHTALAQFLILLHGFLGVLYDLHHFVMCTECVFVHAGKEEIDMDHTVPRVEKSSSRSTLVPGKDSLDPGVRPRPSSMLVRPTTQLQPSTRSQDFADDSVESGSMMLNNPRAHSPKGPPQATPGIKDEGAPPWHVYSEPLY